MSESDYSLRKHLTKLSANDLARVKELSELDLTGLNETAIREQFLAPLLSILGYRPKDDYQVLYEDSFALRDWYVMYGRTRFKLDYRLVVWKSGLWLLEAKPGPKENAESRHFKPEDAQQAFSYSTHPDIDAPIFAVSNGAVTSVYDRDVEGLEPILTVTQEELPAKIDQLRELLAADQVQFYLKRKLLKRIEQVLSSELVLSRPDEFVDAVRHIATRVRPRVHNNFRANAAAGQSITERWDELVSSSRPYEIIETFFLQQMPGGLLKRLCQKVAGSVPVGGEYLFFSRLLLEELRPVTIHYHHNVFYLLGVLAERGVVSDYVPRELRGSDPKKISASDLFVWWWDLLVSGFRARPELRVLWLVEGTAGRIAKRLLLVPDDQRKNIERQAQIIRFMLAERDVDRSLVSPAAIIIRQVEGMILAALAEFVDEFYDEERREFKLALARQRYEALLAVEKRLDAENYDAIVKELGDSRSALIDFDSINKTYDLLGAGAINIAREFPQLYQQASQTVGTEAAILASLNTAAGVRFCEEQGINVEKLTPTQMQLVRAERFKF